MKPILEILNELAATNSSIEKTAILKREKNNELLKSVFEAAYNPMISYYIKKIPEYVYGQGMPYSLKSAIASIKDNLASRKVTGNDAISALKSQLSFLSTSEATVLERIIDRDLRCGTTDTLAAKVWPGLVPVFDVMLSHKDISGIKFPAYAQKKSDGARCHMSLQAGRAVAFSRNGKPIELHGVFDADLKNLVNEGDTVDGELLAMRDGKILDRKTGNGIINSLINITDKRQKLEDKICQLEKKLKEL